MENQNTKSKTITDKDLESKLYPNTYRFPKELFLHMSREMADIKFRLQDKDLPFYDYQFLIAAIKISLQEWWEKGEESEVFKETEHIAQLMKELKEKKRRK